MIECLDRVTETLKVKGTGQDEEEKGPICSVWT